MYNQWSTTSNKYTSKIAKNVKRGNQTVWLFSKLQTMGSLIEHVNLSCSPNFGHFQDQTIKLYYTECLCHTVALGDL